MRIVGPHPLSGALRAMPSKSASHRALLCAALAEGESEVAPLQPSRDVAATLECVVGMGLARTEGLEPLPSGGGMFRCRVRGGRVAGAGERVAPCGESGSTLRFLMPAALDGGGPVRFTGEGRLLERPLDVYRALFATQGASWEDGDGCITLRGALRAGAFELPGDVSSQFVSGLLFALHRLAGDSVIRLTGAVESRAYIDLTLDALARAGVEAAWIDDRTLAVPGGQRARAGTFGVEGDWSHAAFFLVAGLIGGPVRLTGLDAESRQGDRAILDILRGMGGDIARAGDDWVARPSTLRGARIDVSQAPDLAPALAVAACAARGRTVIHGGARLRLKESDRLAALRAELAALGADIAETPDGLIIEGGRPLAGGRADAHNDHRIAMALAVAAALCDAPVALSGDEAVAKSAPDFWAEYAALGGRSARASAG